MIRHSAFGILAVLGGLGCFPKPNSANIALRKEVQSLESRVNELETRHRADLAQMAALEQNRTVQTLPAEKLQRLFTCSGIAFKRLVIGEDLDASKPGDEGFKVAIVPIDAFGDEFKAAGAITIEIFDLANKETRLGTWSVETPAAQKLWISSPVFDGYLLRFPWQTTPKNGKLLVKATFVEELTGRTFDATTELTVDPPKS